MKNGTALLAAGALFGALVGCMQSTDAIVGSDGTDPSGSKSTGTTSDANGRGSSGGSGTTGGDQGAREGGAMAQADAGSTSSDGSVVSNEDGGTSTCLAGVAPELQGKHNEGSNCMQSGCHDGSNGASKWTVAGTLYSNGIIPAIGATIEVTDANGKVVKIATSFDGNFHTTEAVTFPLSVRASACPNDSHMMAKVTSTQGCNQASCHDGSMPMHLP